MRYARSTLSCDSNVSATHSVMSYDWKQHEETRKMGTSQWTMKKKRLFVPVRNSGDWNYFSQGVLFIINDSHFIHLFLNVGWVGMGEGSSLPENCRKRKVIFEKKTKRMRNKYHQPHSWMFQLYLLIKLCFHLCVSLCLLVAIWL